MVTQVFLNGFLAALFAGFMTGVGGLCIFLKKRYSKTQINMLLNLLFYFTFTIMSIYYL